MIKKLKFLAVFAGMTAILYTGLVDTPSVSADQDTEPAIFVSAGSDERTYQTEDMSKAWDFAAGESTAGKVPVKLRLLCDWQPENALVVPNGAEIQLDLNGHIIDRGLLEYKSDGQLFTVKKGGRLMLTDSDSNAMHTGYAVRGGVLTGGKSSGTAGCIEMKAGSYVSISGCTVINCSTQQDGGAVRMDGVCELNVDGTSFITNYASDSRDECWGGAIYVGDGTAIVKNALFDGNFSEDDGGALYVNGSYHDITAKGCAFLSNSSEENGGAVNVNGCTKFIIENAVFSDNSSANLGGAIYIEADHVVLANSTVVNNSADKNGGGIFVDSLHDIGVQGKVIVRNNLCGEVANNLCLQNGKASTAYISNGGLYEGSMIYLTTNSDSRVKASKEFSAFQRNQYIRSDKGRATLDEQSAREVKERFVASAIGKGSMIVILSMLMAAVVLVSVISRKVSKSAKAHETSEPANENGNERGGKK